MRVWKSSVALSLLVLLSIPMVVDRRLHALEPQQEAIEITIRDSTFVKTKTTPIRPELPIAIIIHNDDSIRHGFTSPMLKGLLVEGDAEGVDFYGRGVDGVHIKPGKTVTLRMLVPAQGSFPFNCDLHSDMQGELYLLQVPVA